VEEDEPPHIVDEVDHSDLHRRPGDPDRADEEIGSLCLRTPAPTVVLGRGAFRRSWQRGKTDTKSTVPTVDDLRLASVKAKSYVCLGHWAAPPGMDMNFGGGKEGRTLGLASWRLLLSLAVLLAGCSPGANMVDNKALEARLDYQSAFPSPATVAFAPTSAGRYLRPDITSFVLGPDDVVKISVANQSELDTVQPVRPDGKIAVFPAGDIQAGGRTVGQIRDEIVSRLRAKSGSILSAWHSGCH
jgi:hypothetical protein